MGSVMTPFLRHLDKKMYCINRSTVERALMKLVASESRQTAATFHVFLYMGPSEAISNILLEK